ncbi:MAG: hypothetical protein IJF00_00560 [Bacteroidaceae bacterium]|nr:hypothetical protein [Bacteroidaceae bacterium]MBQ3122425.1 hypothetical protein [Bacteroidaceae bacterium]
MEGLDKFREAFKDFSDNYVIIGGTACDITMTGTEVHPRATHDIDMIIVVERMTPQYGERFWQFIREAGYRPEKSKAKEGESPKYEMYRFVDGNPGFPEMIELLSRHPDVLGEPKGLTIEPLPIDGEQSSLSAIIMDDDYYRFTIEHSRLTDDIRHADSAALVALKARAYLNLIQDKQNGKHVNSKDIKKHRSDVLKNVVIMTEDEIPAPSSIVECVKEFVMSIRSNWEELANPLAKSLDQNPEFVEALLEQLENLFAIRS